MGGGDGCVRVVATRPGALTGETLYRTEDGRWWTSEVQRGSYRPTGSIRGQLRGGCITASETVAEPKR